MAHPIVALIKKNVILKRSSVLGLVLELVLPIALVVLIAVIVKNAGIQLRNASGKHKDTDMFTVLTKVGVQFQSPTSYMPVDWDLSTPEDFFPSARGHGAPIETVADANFKPTDLHEIIAGGLPHVQSAIKFEADNKATFMHLPMVVNAVSPILLAIHGMYKRVAAAAGTGHVNEVDFVIFEFASVSDKRYILLGTAYILMLCFTAAVSHLSSSIVQERALRLREVMKIQGVKDWHIYVSWFITYTAIYLLQAVAVSVTLVLIAFKGFSVILLGCGVFLFTMASAALALTITSVFDSPRTGSIVGISFMIALFLVCVSLECNKPILEQVPAMIVPFYAFKHFMLGASNMARAKKTLANVFEETNYANEHFNPGVALVMLLVDTFIFNLLYLYVEKVIPHEFGQRLPWYFPFNPHYWLGDKKPGLQEVQRDPSNDLVQEPLNSREQQLIAENAVADFKHMTKVFKIDGGFVESC